MWKSKKTKPKEKRQKCNGRSTTNLYPAYAWEVGPWLEELQKGEKCHSLNPKWSKT